MAKSYVFCLISVALTMMVGCVMDDGGEVVIDESSISAAELEDAMEEEELLGRGTDYTYYLAVDVCDPLVYNETYDGIGDNQDGEWRNQSTTTELYLECSIPLIYPSVEGFANADLTYLRMYGYNGNNNDPEENIEGTLYSRGTGDENGTSIDNVEIDFSGYSDTTEAVDFVVGGVSAPFLFVYVTIPVDDSGRDSWIVGFRAIYVE